MRAAFATEPLLDAGISLKSRYIQELATKDQFKTMLQGRLASCLNQGSETAATFAGNTAKNGRGGKNNPGAEVKPRPQQVRSPAGRQAARRSGSERSQGQKADRSGRVPAKSGAVRSERTAPKAPAAKEMPPALAQFIAEVEKQPGGALKVAPERQAAVAELLRSAGLGSEAVEKLLTDPKVQENGLTAEALKACWLENRPALSASGTEGRSPNLAGRPAAELDRQEIIASPEYQNRWSRLTVPADTWPELRLELQRLGVAPAELAKLEEQVNGQGISLEQVMRLLKEVPDSGAAAAGQASSPGRETGRLEPLAGDEVAAWRQLLQKAGLEPQVLEALGDSQGPGNAEELRQTLVRLSPPPPAPEALDAPKPLYLPRDLRLRTLALDSAPEQGFSPKANGGEQDSQGLDDFANLPSGSRAAAAAVNFQPMSGLGPAGAGSGAGVTTGAPAGAAGLGGWADPLPQMSPEVQQSLWSQVQSGILTNLRPGETQVTLNLNPPELGQVDLTLSVKGQHLEITAIASQAEAAQVVQAGVQQLVQALANQGFILNQFQVRHQEVTASLPGVRELGKPPEPQRDKTNPGSPRQSRKVDRFV